MGSKYASKKPKDKSRKGELFHTPMSLTRELLKVQTFQNVLEPANGKGAISKVLKKIGVKVTTGDIIQGNDFFNMEGCWNGDIVTNPPFSLWDRFVEKAKSLGPNRICFIGRVNYFGTHGRNINGIWNNLKIVYVFDRMVDYQTPYRRDGLFHVGWFIWEKNYNGEPEIKIMDVQRYATLGLYKEKKK